MAAPLLEPALAQFRCVPVDTLQLLFAGLDPYIAVRKFLNFARLDPGSRRAEDFVALEDWLNDGVPLPAAVARTCFYDWYGRNTTAQGLWKVAGRPVDPGEVACPSLVVVPERDRVVPPPSAAALGAALPSAAVWRPPLGHIGMVASRAAKEALWGPLLTWLTEMLCIAPKMEC